MFLVSIRNLARHNIPNERPRLHHYFQIPSSSPLAKVRGQGEESFPSGISRSLVETMQHYCPIFCISFPQHQAPRPAKAAI
jgi:hypothetical protein